MSLGVGVAVPDALGLWLAGEQEAENTRTRSRTNRPIASSLHPLTLEDLHS
jgi:hypothetical protein